jgi:hypothetical protein
LWDLLFDRHPHGERIRGKWEGMGDRKTDIPSDKLILELLEHSPVVLLLDEFQTWYDGLTDTKQYVLTCRACEKTKLDTEFPKQGLQCRKCRAAYQGLRRTARRLASSTQQTGAA